MGVSTVLGALGNLAGLASGTAGSAGGTATSVVSGLLSGAPATAAVGGDGLSNQQFVDLVAVAFAWSPLKGPALGSLWKANFKRIQDPADLAYLQELGVIADAANLTRAEKQTVALLALHLSAGPKPIGTVLGEWKTGRGAENIGSPENLGLFREWGVVA